MHLILNPTKYVFSQDVVATGCCLFPWILACIYITRRDFFFPPRMLCQILNHTVYGMFWFLLMVCGGGGREGGSGRRRRRSSEGRKQEEKKGEERSKTQRKTPAQLVWTEDRSHDLNILGDETCPHCRDSFRGKTCSFSRLRGMHQWSIVATICDPNVLLQALFLLQWKHCGIMEVMIK